MNVIETELSGVIMIEPKLYSDNRGYFYESFQAERYRQAGIAIEFVQDNVSHSTQGVVRGLHYQLHQPQGKLVCVLYGAVLDVIVDIRQGSPTFGRHIVVELTDVNHRQVYIPPGFAHGFSVLSATAGFLYKCTDYYDPASEHGIAWNDPDLAIAWQVEHPLLSLKDKGYPSLNKIPHHELPRL